MRTELNELQGALERFQIARVAFERASAAPRRDADEVLRTLNDLNLAQHLFADTASRIVKGMK